jgi:hypothetical protein
MVSGQLQPGEKIIWAGKPDPWTAASPRIFPLAFLTLWTGVVLSAAWHVYYEPKPSQSGGFGFIIVVPMIGIGAFGLYRALRALLDCWSTAYALTDRRLIIATGGRTQSFTAAALGELSRTGDAQRGSLVFGGPNGRFDNFWGRNSGDAFHANGLYGIADPIRVEALIYKTLIMRKKEEGVSG